MREQAVFRLASLTKPIVTAAAMRMIELGRFSLADPVTRFLPSFCPALANGDVPVITLRHLLTHTAGLSYCFMQPLDGSYHRAGVSDRGNPGVTMEEELARIVSAGLVYPPGESWGYSVAMDVLGFVMQVVENADLDAVVRKYVCEPLRLNSIGFELKPALRDLLVSPYADGKPAPVLIPTRACGCAFPKAFRSTPALPV